MLWAVLGVLLIAVVAYYSFTFLTAPQIDIRKFTGNVISVEGETIKLHGVFYGPSGTIPATLSAERDFSFRVDDATVFRKTTIQLPTPKEIPAKGGKFNVQDLHQEKGAGSLADLANSLSGWAAYVEADFPASILNSQNPIASYVFYRVLTIPTPQ